MSENFTPKELRRQVYLYYSEDGLVDLAIGLVITGFGVLLLAGLPALVGILGLIPLLIWYFGKQLLTLPRVGSLQPDRAMSTRFLGITYTLVIVGAVLFLLILIRPDTGASFLEVYSLTLFGLVLGLVISALGFLMKTNRYYLYGLLVFLSITLGELLNRSITAVDWFLLAVIFSGGIILFAGVIVLVRFLKKYPIVSLDR
jgi:hypothetical protein